MTSAWERSTWRNDRRRALKYYPSHLTEVLLELPEPARSELRDVIDGTLMPLASIRDNQYRIPPGKPCEGDDDQHYTFTRGDFDNIISELQALVTLLEDEPTT